MKTLITSLLLALTLGGCAQLQSYVPSFWDDNQSAKITDIRVTAEEFDCRRPHLAQIERLKSQLLWFELYSESKGPRQTDVRRALKPLNETVNEFWTRTQVKEGSEYYCKIKVEVIRDQSRRAASAVLGRF